MCDDNWDEESEGTDCVAKDYNNGTNFGMGRGMPQKKNYSSLGSHSTYCTLDNIRDNSRCGKESYNENCDNGNDKNDYEINTGFDNDNNSFGFDNNDNQSQDYRGHQRFRNHDQLNGSGNRRGVRGSGGNFGNRNNEKYNDNGESRTYGGNRGAGRGGRGGGRNLRGNEDDSEAFRGGFRSNSGDDSKGFGRNEDRKDNGYRGHHSSENEQPEKPREIYIPPERFDEKTVYGTGVKAGINFNNYNNIDVNTSGESVPPPIETFKNANLKELVQENIKKSGYNMPTPVQKYAFPILMANRDLMACAQTGSGKTAAFMIPIVNKLLMKSNTNYNSSSCVEPRAIIIAPTRELCTQIYNQARKFSNYSSLKCQQIYGGTSVEYQTKQLMKGCDILAATPGRLIDFMHRNKISFNAIEFIVLDEADKMLDMGFSEDVEKIFRHESMVPKGERQTLMFSATFPPKIQELAATYMNNYVFVAVGAVGGACRDIEQTFIQISKRDKRAKLDELLRFDAEHTELYRILVFVDMKKTADFIAAFLSENNFPTTSIHGDRLQREREEALEDFKAGRMPILVATAVAARGLDVQDVSHVINYDLPKDIDEYIHRIGRTGRVGNKGKATSFYDESTDYQLKDEIVKVLTVSGQVVPDWLSSSNSCKNYAPTSAFGGHDIRSFSDVQNFSQGGTQPVENEEEW